MLYVYFRHDRLVSKSLRPACSPLASWDCALSLLESLCSSARMASPLRHSIDGFTIKGLDRHADGEDVMWLHCDTASPNYSSIGRCKATRAPASRPMQALFPDYLVPRAEDDGVTPSDDGHDGGGCFIYVDTDGSPLQSLLPWHEHPLVGKVVKSVERRIWREDGVPEAYASDADLRSGDTTISVFHLSDGSLFCASRRPPFFSHRTAPSNARPFYYS